MDVYDECPTIVTTWLTIMPKITILIFLLSLISELNLNLVRADFVGGGFFFSEFYINSFFQ